MSFPGRSIAAFRLILGITVASFLVGITALPLHGDDATTGGRTSSRAAVSSEDAGSTGNALAITRRQNADGTRIVQVIENDKMIRIVERPRRGISVVVVESVKGEQKVSRYAARNAAALKTRHPRGYALYQRYIDRASTRAGAPDSAAGTDSEDAVEASLRAEIAQLRRQMQQQMARQRLATPRRQGVRQRQQQSAASFRRTWGFSSASAAGRASASAQGSASGHGRASSRSRSSGSSTKGQVNGRR